MKRMDRRKKGFLSAPPRHPRDQRSRLGARLLGWSCTLLLRLQRASWRAESAGEERLDRLLAGGEKVMVAFWHGKYPALFPLLRGRRACILASRSFRGEVICEICRRFGYDCLRIPPHPGEPDREAVLRAVNSSGVLAIALDGPLGPYHVVRHGAIRLAADHGFVLLPVSLAARRRRVLRRRWDWLEIPAPFTRIHLLFGEPLQLPAPLPENQAEAWSRRLHDILEELGRLAEEQVGGDGGRR